MRECVAAIVVREHKVLLGKRSTGRAFYPGIWDVFGGHLEPNESDAEALLRELGEELGIVPTDWKFLLTVDDPDPAANGEVKYHFYLVTAWDGEPRNLQPEEHDFIEWFEFERAINLPFVHPLYAELIEDIFKELES